MHQEPETTLPHHGGPPVTPDPVARAVRDPVHLASLILFGDPTPDEPLSRSWARTVERLGLAGEPDWMLADRLRARVVQGLDGETEAEKLAAVLRDGPDWLVARHVRALAETEDDPLHAATLVPDDGRQFPGDVPTESRARPPRSTVPGG